MFASMLLKNIIRKAEAEHPAIVSDRCINLMQARFDIGDLNIHCLASLPWEIYVALALDKKVFFSSSQCASCEYAARAGSLLERIRETIGAQMYAERFLFSSEEGSENNKESL